MPTIYVLVIRNNIY